MGVRLLCNPSRCLLSPVLSCPSHTTWDCFILLVETALQMPQNPPFHFASQLPHKWHCCPFTAPCIATAATLEQIFCSVTRVRAQRGKIPLCFPETGHAAPAAGLGPVPKGGQETVFCTLRMCFVKLSEMSAAGPSQPFGSVPLPKAG